MAEERIESSTPEVTESNTSSEATETTESTSSKPEKVEKKTSENRQNLDSQNFEKRMRDKDAYISQLQREMKEKESWRQQYEPTLKQLDEQRKRQLQAEYAKKLQAGDTSVIDERAREIVKEQLAPFQQLQERQRVDSTYNEIEQKVGKENLQKYEDYMVQVADIYKQYDAANGTHKFDEKIKQPDELYVLARGLKAIQDEKNSKQVVNGIASKKAKMAPAGINSKTSAPKQLSGIPEDFSKLSVTEMEKLMKANGMKTIGKI